MKFDTPFYEWCLLGGLLLVTFITGVVYLGGLPGAFMLDDFHSLGGIALYGGVEDFQGVLRYLFGNDGLQWSRSFAYLSFLVDDQYWPSFPGQYKLTNIAIHLITGLFIFLFLRALLGLLLVRKKAVFLAVLSASLWLLHPLHVSTTLYVVQRMTQLATLFVVLAMTFHVYALKAKTYRGFVVYILLAVISGLLGVLSKESALTGVWLMALICAFFFKREDFSLRLQNVYSLMLIGAAVSLFVLFVLDAVGSSFDFRVFDQWERLAIQGMVLAKYLQYWVWPWGADMGLFHDDIEQLLVVNGVGWQVSWWLLHLFLLCMAGAIRKSAPVVSFGICFFYLSHIIESTIWPLELMFEHRNYLPVVGLALIFGTALLKLNEFVKSKGLPVLGGGIIFLYVGLLLIPLIHRVSIWSDYRVAAFKWAYEHPLSVRAQLSVATILSSAGMVPMAVDKLHEVYEQMPRLSIRLQQLNLQCTENVSQEHSVKLTREEVYRSPFDSGLVFHLNEARKRGQLTCVENYFDGFDIPWLFDTILNKPDLLASSRFHASFLDMVGHYYVENYNFTDAVIVWEKMYEVQPTIDTALRLADLYVQGGNFEQAQIYIDVAKVMDGNRWYKDDRRRKQIGKLQFSVDYLKQQKQLLVQ
ncbi:hypothetical protein [Pseudomaricurvus albidus]|uniref:hypothetical protein n=1 Tax=Pseudomaricurvus albidus TaxID=2842452 RepID=UPI001C0D32C5|nr:hypothetical protein [Aestuariicella albida]